MGYTLDLGYLRKQPRRRPSFELARVTPFLGGSNVPTYSQSQLNTVDEVLKYGTMEMARVPGDDQLVDATIDVTFNYSSRIIEIGGEHLANAIDGRTAAESIGYLALLYSGFREEPYTDYWSPTDGNIRHLVGTLVDWSFQHPEATWRDCC